MKDGPASNRKPPEFLEQSVYRRRRLIDAIKLLPVLGGCLFLLPALILGDGAGSTAMRLVYFFFTWVVLIMICAVLVRALSRSDEEG
ncbi:hypothetical protein [uncultured Litoreibacter sp.]|uniref:hypothetical protein n=1 Tax=uncultured Litoreibacter sp. TaxID=1392394 RepID=UPI00263553E4|nr:hypothetical protein [uncultured Litoreibacter sp.]